MRGEKEKKAAAEREGERDEKWGNAALCRAPFWLLLRSDGAMAKKGHVSSAALSLSAPVKKRGRGGVADVPNCLFHSACSSSFLSSLLRTRPLNSYEKDDLRLVWQKPKRLCTVGILSCHFYGNTFFGELYII